MTLTRLKTSRYSNTNLKHTYRMQVTIAILVPSSSRRHRSEITTSLTELRWDLNLWVTMIFNGEHWPSPGKNYKPATRARRNVESIRHVERDTSSEESWRLNDDGNCEFIDAPLLTINEKQSHDTALTIFFLSQQCRLFFNSNIKKRKKRP